MGIKVCTTLPDTTEICTTVETAYDAASKAYTVTVGDGVTTTFTLTHGLGSWDILPIIRDIATGVLGGVVPVVTATSKDEVTVAFPMAPTVGQYKVTLLAVVPQA